MARLFDRISTAGVLKTVVARYQGKVSRIYFRADARFANPEVYEFLEAEAIAAVMPLFRFAANAVRVQLHALAYHLVNFLRTLATPQRH